MISDEILEQIQAALDTPKKRRHMTDVLTLRWGITRRFTYKEIGAVCDPPISGNRVYQINQMLLRILRHPRNRPIIDAIPGTRLYRAVYGTKG